MNNNNISNPLCLPANQELEQQFSEKLQDVLDKFFESGKVPYNKHNINHLKDELQYVVNKYEYCFVNNVEVIIIEEKDCCGRLKHKLRIELKETRKT